MNVSELIKSLQSDPNYKDKLLYPGKQISDFDINDLKITTMPCGFPSFDESMVFKRNRGELIVIGARPSRGKSALAMQLATGVAQHSKVHMFSLEMDHASLVARQLATEMNRPLDYVQRGGADSPEGKAAKERLKAYDCVIDDQSGLTVDQITERVKSQHMKSKVGLVVIDYIQIIKITGDNRAVELGKVSLALKQLAKELNIPVVVLSQLNRASESKDRKDGRPQLSDLKESGSIEQDADVVLLIHRPDTDRENATIIIAKNRNGPTRDIHMKFFEAQCRFIDLNPGRDLE